MSASDRPPGRGAVSLSMLLFALSAAAGCDKALPSANCTAFGDPSMPIQIAIGQDRLTLVPDSDPSKDRITSATFLPLAEGDTIDLYFPPQGGHVSYLGARATNLLGCNLTMRSALFDLDSGNLVQYEERTTALSPAEGLPGWGEPSPVDQSSYDNVPLCPDYLAKDIVGQPYALEVSVTDRDGRNVKARIGKVIPACQEDDPRRRALCECECRGHYTLGACNNADGGAVDASPDGHP